MYSTWQLARKYIAHRFSSFGKKGHGIHSPFVYDFVRTVLMDKKKYPAFEKIELLRKQLLKDQTEPEVLDLGAGSSIKGGKKRTVASIAMHAAKSPKLGQLLFKIVQRYKPDNVIELGTSLGLSASYLSMGNPGGSVYTIEGSPAIAEIAKSNFKQLGLTNITGKTGDFNQVLPGLLNDRKPGLVFVDGNHRFEPTIQYFDMILPHIQPDSIVIFDDIHWSAEMEKAWVKIRSNPAVTCSIDLFFLGMIFFRSEFREKQDFRVRI
jgi:predicted O-methyltransferase YrrM